MNFIDIIKLSQEELKDFLADYLVEKKYDKTRIFNTEDYLLAVGNIPIMLVAHLDTVHKETPKTILYDKEQKLIWSPEGIGGDDRCGVFAIMKLVEKYRPFILFTTDEETGGLGAEAFTKDVKFELKNYIDFIIEIDRRGSNDAVFYQCGNKDFIDYILSFGFEEEWGTFTDISILSPAYDIASVNLSSGYYNEHQKIEYVNLGELENTIEKIGKILEDKENWKYYNYQKKVYTYPKNYSYYDDSYWDSYYDTEFSSKKLLEDDYKELTNKMFREYYGFDKPKTMQEFLKKMGYK